MAEGKFMYETENKKTTPRDPESDDVYNKSNCDYYLLVTLSITRPITDPKTQVQAVLI
jgi:hypothetical protein